MEMHQARYFVALCETLNFTRAAEKCNVTQPSLTRAIKLLEEELGGPLFNRERNQTHLTELGRMMEPHLREVIEQAKTARARASSFFALRTARLKLGVARGVSFRALDDTLRRFVTSYPDTEIGLHDDRPDRAARSAAPGRFRGGLSCPSVPTTSTTCTTTRSARIVCEAILPEGHALGCRWPPCRWRPLADLPLVCGDGCPFWEAAERSFHEAGPSALRRRQSRPGPSGFCELVSAGVGIGVAALHGDLPAGLVTRPVEGAALAHDINLTTKRGRLYSPPVKAFVDLALKPRPRPQPATTAATDSS